MYSPPFHRRILPWIFAATFLIVAPALVFYTAGYRWNSKKNKVERNGTLIFDSTPAGARIMLNGTNSGELTPVTLQNIPPASYAIRFEKDGYHAWEKRLDVRAEYVTFANDVRLWKTGEPVQLDLGPANRLAAAPNEKLLAMLTTATTSAKIVVWNVEANTRQEILFAKHLDSRTALLWSDDSGSLLLEEPGGQSWFVNTKKKSAPLALAAGNYRWNGNRLEGTTDASQLTIDAGNGSVSQQPLATGVVDSYDDFILRHATGTDNLVLFQNANLKRGLILPPGDWRIASLQDSRLILRDGRNWISLDPDQASPDVSRAHGDRLRSYSDKGYIVNLLVDGGEVWRWDPAADPELLLRDSQAVPQALWHSGGRDVTLATNQAVGMLNLDPRDGRLRTALASFDTVDDIAILQKTLYVAGTKNGYRSLWSLIIE